MTLPIKGEKENNMSTTITVTLDTKNPFHVQALASALSAYLMNQSYDHKIHIDLPEVEQ
jgi:hypothetical protein